ncbi:hypothetical protein M5D96_011242 [Drosophila gunungcola]|uniref:Uncharacterized protein n=1 Tax=Drosophila gunungcola TaxID=103775 RepID=A0A9P9YG58_9MUSC|nr:hypothetical protein M5D96_011242 [Drosophila gunungcola]
MSKMEESNLNGSEVDTVPTDVSSPNAEIIRGQIFEVGPRYTKLAYIGEGAYGMVVRLTIINNNAQYVGLLCRHNDTTFLPSFINGFDEAQKRTTIEYCLQ